MALDRDVRAAAAQWLGQGLPAVVVSVVDARGSVPRAAGTRMLVSSVQTLGTIGGGHLEWRAIERARALLRADAAGGAGLGAGAGAPGTDSLSTEHIPLGPALGQCCGGAVTLGWQRLSTAALAAWPEASPLMRLQLHGAGHVGQALATLLCTLDIELDWIDERDDAFAPVTTLGTPWPSAIRRLAVDAPEAEVAPALPGTAFLVMTHQHDLDLRIVEAVLRRGEFRWLGLIGSATKRARFEHRLRARGFTEAQCARLCCPIGVDGIHGKPPEIIAMAVAAQLLQVAEATSREAAAPALSAPTLLR